jgi:hypothetical protein
VYPTVSGSIAAHNAAEFQSALSSAVCGQEIVLDAGVSYIGNFWMPPKTCTGPILVRSTEIDQLPAGKVPSRPQTAHMPHVSTPNGGAVLLDAFTYNGSSAGTGVLWYWAGIELTAQTGVQFWDLIQFGGGEPPFATVDQLLHGIVFDRCMVHGNDQMSARGFAAEVAGPPGFALINSRAYDFSNCCQDTQPVGACQQPGPYLISNNVLEATGENVMFGGCPTYIGVPSDITVTRNRFMKNLTWNGWIPPNSSQPYDVKDEFEIKNGQRVLVDSNLFMDDYGEAQNEFIILNCGLAPDEEPQTCFDITITNNVFAHGPQVFIAGGGANSLYAESLQRVLVRNNVAYDINGTTYTGPGNFARVNYSQDVTVDHNTSLNQPSDNIEAGVAFSDPPPSSNMGFTYTNNIVYSSITANGMDPLQSLQNFPPDANLSYDVFVGDVWPNSFMGPYPSQNHFSSPSSTATPVVGQPACNELNKPIVQCYPLDLALVGFTGTGASVSTLGNLVLAPTSPYYKAGSDGADIGANVRRVQAAVQSTPQ